MNAFLLTKEQTGSLCGALSHLLAAGISPGDAFSILSQDETKGDLRSTLEIMAQKADGGAPFASLFREAGCFPGYVCGLLEVADRVGQCQKALASLSRYYHRRSASDRRLRAALTYPAVLLAVLLAVVGILLIWVLPVFNDVYAQLGSGLTGFAGFLLTLGKLLGKLMPWIALLAAATVLLFVIPFLRRRLFRLFKTLWGDRGAAGQVSSARYLQALTLGLQSGMTQEEAAALAGSLSQGECPAFIRRCNAFTGLLDQGTSLPQALQKCGFFSRSDCRLLEAGVRSGHLLEVLEQTTQDLLERSEEANEKQMAKIEPVMVFVACCIIGAVLLTVMLPLMQIMNTIG